MSELDVAVAQLPSTLHKSGFCMMLHGGRDQVAMAVKTGGWDRFEAPFPTYFFKCAQAWPGLIIDIGANTGFYTLLGAAASPINRVLAFEPDVNIMKSLKENVRLSELDRQVRFSTLAISSEAGTATFYIPGQEHGLIETSSSLESTFKGEHSELRQVETDTLDAILSSGVLTSKPVSFIKVDVEGHERHVLVGAHATINMWRPILFVEVLGSADTGYLTDFIVKHGYIDIALSVGGLLMNRGEVRFFAEAWNHAFVPREKAEAFVGLSKELT